MPSPPKVAYPNQVVGRERQDKLKVQLRAADKPALAHAADGVYGELLFKRLQVNGIARGNEIATGIG